MLCGLPDDVLYHMIVDADDPLELCALLFVNKTLYAITFRAITVPNLARTRDYCDAVCIVPTTRRAHLHMLHKRMRSERAPSNYVPYICVDSSNPARCTRQTQKNQQCSRRWTHTSTRYCGLHHAMFLKKCRLHLP